jgi:hypothetical protein
MTFLEQVQQQVKQLPPEQQSEVLDFAAFLRQRLIYSRSPRPRSLRQHPAFGSWRERQIDALQYQQDRRAEWDPRQ